MMAERGAWQGHAGVALDTVNGFTVIECDACRFKHIVPIPTPAELEQVYRQEYYSTEKPLYIQHQREDLEWMDVVYAERYEAFERLLGDRGRRLLDVGSGPGYFLLHGLNRPPWIVRGIEPSPTAAAHGRSLGLDITETFLTDESAAALGRYDVVHLNEVLEHVVDPRAVLGTIHGMLEPGGLVALMVPNDYSPFQAALRDGCDFRPWWVAPPHHINYFDVGSIEALVGERFDVVSIETSFPIDMFLLMGDNYIGHDEVGRACHAKRKTFEINLQRAGKGALKQEIYRSLARLGIGRDVFLIARKR